MNSEIKDILFYSLKSYRFFAQHFFPDRFHREFSPMHDEVFDLIDDPKVNKIAISAFRGFGKSSLLNLVVPARAILFRTSNFIVQVSHTASQAVMDSEALKSELMSNEEIVRIFGEIAPEGRGSRFSKDLWETPPALPKHYGTAILPRGWGQQIRGMKAPFGRYRPDLLLCDDLESSEEVRSEEQREKMKRWFFSDLLNSVERSDKKARGEFPWKIILIGTILHEDSLLATLVGTEGQKSGWVGREYSVADDNMNSNWEEFMDTEKIQGLYQEAIGFDLVDDFMLEYQGKPGDPKRALFQSKFFKHYRDAELDLNNTCENVIIVDPAKTRNLRSKESAVVCWGIDNINNQWYVRDIINGKLSPEELYEAIFSMINNYNARVLAVEVTGLNDFIKHPIKTLMLEKGMNIETVWLDATGGDGGKDNRIFSLAPFYRRGFIYHNENVCQVLELQLMSMPRSRLKDVADAAAYIVPLLEKGERYMSSSTNPVMSEVDFEKRVKEAQKKCEQPFRLEGAEERTRMERYGYVR